MYYQYICTITILLLCAFFAAEGQQVSNAKVIINNTNSQGVVAIGTPNHLCASSLFLLTNSSSSCLLSTNASGIPFNSSCAPRLEGASSIFCVNTLCFIAKPSVGISAVNVSGALIGAAFGAALVNPVAIIAIATTATNYLILVVDFDGTTSTIWSFVFSGTAGSAGTNILQLGSLAGIFFFSSTSFGTATLHGQSIQVYSTSGASTGTFGPAFTSIESVSIDYYGRVYVYDAPCSCVKVVSDAGTLTSTFTHGLVPWTMSHTRDAHFIVDASGVTSYYEILSFVTVSTTNSTCMATGGSAQVTVSGGAAPYTYSARPFLPKVISSNPSYTFTGITPYINYTTPFYIYNDSLSTAMKEAFGSGSRVPQADSSIVTPLTGNYSYCMYFTYGTHFSLNFIDALNATLFERVEVWVNPGAGGQAMNLNFGNGLVYYYYGNDFPLNTWTKLVYELGQGNSTTYPSLVFSDMTRVTNVNLVNPFCIDNVVLIPYDTAPHRKFYATDFCSNTVESPNVLFTDENELRVAATSTPTTCNPEGSQGTTGSDGVLTATASGGSGSYTYSWSFMNTTTSNSISGLAPFNQNLLVYDNSVASGFTEVGAAASKIIQDPTFYRSPPYSLSFAPYSAIDNIIFNFPQPFNTRLFSSIDLWIYTGDGGQNIDMSILRGGAVTYGQIYTLAQLAGVPYLLPNQWFKISYPIEIPKTPTNISGFMFVFDSQNNYQQSRIYFDDITMISTANLVTVTDSSGCVATNSYLNVTSPPLIITNVSTSNVKCHGGSNGGVSLSIQGGTAPYYFAWSDTSISNTISNSSNFSPSLVSANVTDSFGCKSPTAFTYVVQPPALAIRSTVNPISCFGEQVRIAATALGGTSPYRYTWSSGSNSSYSVIPTATPFSAFSDGYDSRFEKTGGNISIMCAGGSTAPISSSSTFSPSHEGYCSLVVEKNSTLSILQIGCLGCIDTSQYQTVQLFIALEDPRDFANLTIALTQGSFGVTSPMKLANYSANYTSFAWQQIDYTFESFAVGLVDSILIRSTSATKGLILVDDVVLLPKTNSTSSTGINVRSGFQSTISGGAQTYTLTIVDGNGCQATQSFDVLAPTQMILENTVASNGDVKLNVTGGVPPYTYTWENMNNNASSANRLASGSYTVSVTDSYGCSVQRVIVVVNSGSRKSITGILAGTITGAGVLVIGLAIFVYWRVNRKQREHVQALLEAEEGERNNYKIDFAELSLGSSIGAGSFGEVYSGEYKGTEVAVKKLKSQQMTKQQVHEFAKEAAVMVGLRNPNILLFMGVCLEPEKLCIVTEMMPRGDLGELLRNSDIFLPPAMIYKMAQDTLKGLHFIHSSGIIHRDLKSPNLLVDRSWNIKIADFGLSCARHNSSDEAQISLLWTAPEILNRTPDCYSFASDVFSFGVIMWELMSRKLPWEGVNPASITAKVVGGTRPAVPTDWDRATAKLINISWAQDPLSRPTVKEARAILDNEILATLSDYQNSASVTYSNGSSRFGGAGGLTIPPPPPPLALVVARISNSTELWEKDPRGMVQAIDSLTKVMQENCAEHNGYELSTDSTFVYVFSKAIDAVNFCLSAQHALLSYNWPASILKQEAACEEYNGALLIHRGLRVSMGVHWCSPTFHKDAQSGKPMYGGPAMDVGPILPRHGCPGTVVIDHAVYEQIMTPGAALEIDPFAIEKIGAVDCISTTLTLYKLVDESLKVLLTEVVPTPNSSDESEPWLVNFKDIRFGEVLGTGSFGEVYAATYKGKKVAVKKFLRHKMNKQVTMEMRAECALLQSLNHPNILEFEGMCMQSPNMCLLTSIMEKGSLSQILYAATDLPWKTRIGFAKDAARGMMYLHQNDIIHRDIKSSNMLVGADWSVKIADFGFSRIKAVNQTMTQCGTVAWTAPEIFDDSHYTEKADVYSYGIVLWEIIFRNKPWTGKHSMKIIQAVVDGSRPSLHNMPFDTPEFIKLLMVKCWAQKAEYRPTFAEIVDALETGAESNGF